MFRAWEVRMWEMGVVRVGEVETDHGPGEGWSHRGLIHIQTDRLCTLHGDCGSTVVFSGVPILHCDHGVLATVTELCILNDQLCSLALMVHAVLGAALQQLPILLPAQCHILGCQLTLKTCTTPLFHTYILEGAHKLDGDACGQRNAWLPTTYVLFCSYLLPCSSFWTQKAQGLVT